MSRTSRAGIWVVFILAVVIVALLTLLRRQTVKSGVVDPVTDSTRRFLLAPSLRGINSTELWWRTDVSSLFRGPKLARDNTRLRTEVAVLMQQNRERASEESENQRLRSLLGFKNKSPQVLLPAEVLSLKPSPLRDSAIFSRGNQDKIYTKETALSPGGALAGQVVTVSSDTCDVMLLTDTLSSVGATVVPTPAPAQPGTASAVPAVAIVGVCMGNRGPDLDLTDLPPDADVKVGDQVITSGLGGIYPKDIPIGHIIRVDFDRTRYLKSATVAPDADFNHLQEGFLLR